MTYEIKNLIFPWQANKRYESLSYSELKRGYRLIGGDRGDLRFDGYGVDGEGTELVGVQLVSSLVLTPEDAQEIAVEIVEQAFESIGAECVEHS
jgi:hypothetical protein